MYESGPSRRGRQRQRNGVKDAHKKIKRKTMYIESHENFHSACICSNTHNTHKMYCMYIDCLQSRSIACTRSLSRRFDVCANIELSVILIQNACVTTIVIIIGLRFYRRAISRFMVESFFLL